jgi:FixJ family two-component response regulator
MMEPVVHIIDDDVPFLSAVCRLMRASGFRVRAFHSAGDFLAQLDPNTAGCALVDLQMNELDGFELQAALARSQNPLPVVFLTGHGDIRSSVRAMRGGAEDFLEKRASKEELLSAVRRAIARDAGERRARARQRELATRFEGLSQRELEVLTHVVQGKLNKQIAADLSIHERTVKLHRSAITRKLGVRSAAQLARLTHTVGLFPPGPTFPKGQ